MEQTLTPSQIMQQKRLAAAAALPDQMDTLHKMLVDEVADAQQELDDATYYHVLYGKRFLDAYEKLGVLKRQLGDLKQLMYKPPQLMEQKPNGG